MTLVWKETVLNVIQKEGKRFNADSIITRKERYMCKKCFYAYEKFAEKKEVGRIFLKLALFNLISYHNI